MIQRDYVDIEAKVIRIVYFNQVSGFGILRIENTIKDDNFPSTESFVNVSGYIEGIFENCTVSFSGVSKEHSKYGNQIELSRITVMNDLTSKNSIVNFLSKSSIKGICLQNAVKIYNKYKEDSIDIVLNNTDDLLSIKGINNVTVNKIKNSVDVYKRMENLIEYCTNIGIPFNTIYKLDKELKEEALDILKDNPYKSLEFSDNLNFKTIDSIAIKSGTDLGDKNRIKACLMYSLNKCIKMTSSTGTGFNSVKLKTIFFKELGVDDLRYYNAALTLLEEDGEIIVESNVIYNKKYYEYEREISDNLKTMIRNNKKEKIFNKTVIEEEISSFPYELNEQQVFAIKKCLLSNVSVLTGSGGTGKSTVTKALANIYDRSGFRVILLTPTGKATRRMEECTNRKCSTIHKFVYSYESNEDNDGDLLTTYRNRIIFMIDESSMVDIDIFIKLMDIITILGARILLIGDPNQLPSVQSGNVFEDIIKSGVANVCRLTDIMRQAKNSNIIKYCNNVNNGISIPLCNADDFIYRKFESEDLFEKTLCDIYKEEVDKNGIDDVQVISPYKEGPLGINNINKILDDLCNKSDKNEHFGYKVGSKIVALSNNYEKDVFNGETGVVKNIDEHYLYANINGKKIEYSIEEIKDIQLANALTVHRVQGSEYPVVIVVLDDSRGDFLMIRKVLYTALSRGKKKIYLLSKPSCVDTAIRNDYNEPRITKLKSFLQED